MADCLVIGIGNILQKDDGVGVHALKRLRGRVPEGVELLEGSVCCADLLGHIEHREKVIFIDGIDAGVEPGAVFRFSPRELPESKAQPISMHDYGVYELVAASELLDSSPGEIVVFAVQVGEVAPGMELTGEVERALPELCRRVVEEASG